MNAEDLVDFLLEDDDCFPTIAYEVPEVSWHCTQTHPKVKTRGARASQKMRQNISVLEMNELLEDLEQLIVRPHNLRRLEVGVAEDWNLSNDQRQEPKARKSQQDNPGFKFKRHRRKGRPVTESTQGECVQSPLPCEKKPRQQLLDGGTSEKHKHRNKKYHSSKYDNDKNDGDSPSSKAGRTAKNFSTLPNHNDREDGNHFQAMKSSKKKTKNTKLKTSNHSHGIDYIGELEVTITSQTPTHKKKKRSRKKKSNDLTRENQVLESPKSQKNVV